MKQIVVHRNGTQPLPGTITTHRLSFGGSWDNMGSEANARTLWPVDGTIRNVRVETGTSPGSGNTRTFLLRRAPSGSTTFADTTITFTISDAATSGQDTVNEVSVSAGDLLYLQCINTGIAWTQDNDITVSFEFESDNTGESGYTCRSLNLPFSNGNVRINNPFVKVASGSPLDTWMNPASFAVAVAETEMPCAGTLTALYFAADVAPGSGTLTFVLYRNGVKQDGSGGTVNTSLACTGASVVFSTTFSLALAIGDQVYCEVTVTGSTSSNVGHIASRFVADVDGESIMGAVVSATSTGTEYSCLNDQTVTSVTESSHLTRGAVTSFSMSRLRVRLQTAPSGGQSRTTTIRKNTASTLVEVVLTGSATSGQDLTDTVDITTSDTFGMQMVATVSAAGSFQNWLLVQTVSPPTLTAVSILGEDGHVAGLSRVHLVNLDGVTRTLSDGDIEGSAVFGCPCRLAEVSAAPVGVANMATLYAIDNGSGKTRLMVIFGSGSAIELAIEP